MVTQRTTIRRSVMLRITAGSSRTEDSVPRSPHPHIVAIIAARPPYGSTYATPFLVSATEPTVTPREVTTRFPTSSSVRVTLDGIVPTTGRTAQSRFSLRQRGRRRDPARSGCHGPLVFSLVSLRVGVACGARGTPSFDSTDPARRTALMTAHCRRATGPSRPGIATTWTVCRAFTTPGDVFSVRSSDVSVLPTEVSRAGHR